MSEKTEWKTEKDVERLTISPRQLGSGSFGVVYLGRVWFGKKPIRVAVKRFKAHWQLSDQAVREYEETIRNLEKTSAPLPKVGFVQHNGEWVQVMRLFGGTGKRSKLKSVMQFRGKGDPTNFEINPELREHFSEPKNREKLLVVLAQIANSGAPPAPDSVSVVQTKTGNALLVTDLDFYGIHFANASAAKLPRRALQEYALKQWIHAIPGATLLDNLNGIKEKLTHPDAISAIEKIEKKLKK